jgi:ribonuclease Z
MAFDIVFLGTGGSVPRNRFLNATLIRGFGNDFLVDCADGAQYPLLRSGVHLGNKLTILISHEHVDHIGGLGGLLNTLDLRQSARMKIEIFGSSLVLEKTLLLLQMVGSLKWLSVHYNELKSLSSLDYESHEERDPFVPPRRVPIEERPKKWIFDFTKDILKDQVTKCDSNVFWKHKDGLMSIRSFGTDHTEDSYGFIFEEKEHRNFLVRKAEELGVPRGIQRKQLFNNQEVTLADGTIIQPDQVLSAPIKGKKLVLLTDTLFRPDIISYCKDADCLIAPATYLEIDSREAKEHKHLTAKQAGILAKEAGVKKLFLNHVTERYENPQDIFSEAKKVFPNTYLAEDLVKERV